MSAGEVATGGGADRRVDDGARLFAGPGEMRARCRALDWTATPLGPVEGWPQSLRTTVALCLASGFPMLVMWGPELVQLYNDAFRAVLQAKHPAGLGQRARDCWPELWPMIGPMYQGVLDTGVSIFLEDQLFTPERRGEPGVAEEAYFTFSYSAIPDEAHRPAGILATVFETTRHVQSRGERERALERANAELRAAAAERERLLAESEAARARVTATLESIGDAFYAVDAEFRFTYVNRQAEALWGRSRDTLLGRHYWTEFPQAVDSEAYEEHLAVMRERRPAHFESVSPIIGRWVDVSLYPDPVGGGLACYFRDIEARKAAEAALRESEARFRLMADAVPQIVWITDAAGRAEFFNRQWTAYTGRPFEPTTAAEVAATAVHPEDGAVTMARFNEARRTGGVFEVEHRIRSAAGEYRWFLVRAEPYRDPETGEIVRWFGGSVDIHDRKQAEAERERLLAAERAARAEADAARAAVEANERRLAAVITHLPVGLTFAEAPEGRHSVSNPAAVAIWGLMPASPEVAAYSRDFVGFRPGPPGSDERARRIASEEWPLARALLRGEVVQDELVEIERPDGTRRLVSLSAAPVRDADGRVAGALMTTVDVTERERLLADAQAARAEAEAANRAKSEFLAVMSHELRTPLNAIGGYAELIELGIHGPVTDAQRAALARIKQSQRHLLGLIAGVLDYSRVEAGAVTYRLADVPVGEAVAEAETLVAPQLRAKGLGYAWSGAPPELQVRADREKLQQILLNLLGNAVKFTQPRDGVPGRIEVACTIDDERVRLHVRDTGVGIAPEQRELVFEPFVQADQRLTRPQEGVGLGLAISRDLARGMGGDLTAESTPGVGSTFTLTLPRA